MTAVASSAARPAPDPEPHGDQRRRFLRASLAGIVPALVPFLWVVTAGRLDLLRWHPLGGFYDAQAHAWLDLRWDVPAEALLAEAFTVDGRSYMYFGPMPAALRLPVVLFTDRLDGRLTQLSLLAAFVVALWAVSRLSWRVRALVTGPAVPVGRREAVAAGAFTFLTGAGTSLLFNASGPIVYHEAILWGVAWAVAAFSALVAHLAGGGRRALVAAGGFTCLAVLARVSVGLGPVLAIGLVLLWRLVAAWRRGRGAGVWRARVGLAALAVACVLPVALHAAVNVARFGTLFSVPFEAQAVTRLQPGRAEFLERTGGTLFGARYLPTTTLAYVRPDALGFERSFPWVDFPPRATVVGDVELDVVDRSSSLPATAPWLVALGLGGVVVLVRRRTAGARRAARALWAPLLGAAAAPVSTLTIAYVAHRYLSDALPFLVLAGSVGLHALLRHRGRRVGRVLAALGVLGVAACAVNLALAVLYQRAYGPPATPELRRELVAWQLGADRLLPRDQRPHVRPEPVGAVLPGDAADSELVVVGDCDAVYQFDGAEWRAVERTAAVGSRFLDVRLPLPGRPGDRFMVVTGGDGEERRTVWLEARPDHGVGVVVHHRGTETVGSTLHPDPGWHRLEVHLDRRTHLLEAELGGERAHLRLLYDAPDDRSRVADDLGDALVERRPGTPLCDELRPDAAVPGVAAPPVP